MPCQLLPSEEIQLTLDVDALSVVSPEGRPCCEWYPEPRVTATDELMDDAMEFDEDEAWSASGVGCATDRRVQELPM